MYDDPMREQMRQANRIARLQAMTGQHLMGAPLASQTAPAAEPAQQPFDFSRNILGAAGGQLGWMGGAHLAAKLGLAAAGAVPGPIGIGAKAASFGLPLIGMLAGSTAAPAVVDAVSPSIHEGVNSAFHKVGPAGLLGGGALAAYMAYRNRKGLGSTGDDIANAVTHNVPSSMVPSGWMSKNSPASAAASTGVNHRINPPSLAGDVISPVQPSSIPQGMAPSGWMSHTSAGHGTPSAISHTINPPSLAADMPVAPAHSESTRRHYLPPVHSWGEVVPSSAASPSMAPIGWMSHPSSGHGVPSVVSHTIKPPSLADGVGHVMSNIVADPLTASQPGPLAVNLLNNMAPSMVPSGWMSHANPAIPSRRKPRDHTVTPTSLEGMLALKKNKSKRPPK